MGHSNSSSIDRACVVASDGCFEWCIAGGGAIAFMYSTISAGVWPNLSGVACAGHRALKKGWHPYDGGWTGYEQGIQARVHVYLWYLACLHCMAAPVIRLQSALVGCLPLISRYFTLHCQIAVSAKHRRVELSRVLLCFNLKSWQQVLAKTGALIRVVFHSCSLLAVLFHSVPTYPTQVL